MNRTLFYQADPYVMVRDNPELQDNDRFYGFCIDLLKKVAERLHFDYIIELVPDRKYGAVDPSNGEWNGMVRELLEKVSSATWTREGSTNQKTNK